MGFVLGASTACTFPCLCGAEEMFFEEGSHSSLRAEAGKAREEPSGFWRKRNKKYQAVHHCRQSLVGMDRAGEAAWMSKAEQEKVESENGLGWERP